MSPPTKHILLFGDQSVETLSGIQALVRNSKKSPMARRFLQEATDVIQLESSRLNSQEHGWDKPFDSLLGLAEDNNASSGPNTIVSTVLMCVGRLGQLIM
jgi:FtsZ-binding cell division protein ZapB